jgi:diadenylate cyclase
MLDQLADLVTGFEFPTIALLDIALTALLIYGLFSLIRGTRAVRLVIGVTILYAVYVAAQALGLELLSQILQAGAVVGLLALVVVFQPELRRGLERIGRVGSLGWLLAPGAHREVEQVAGVIARSAAVLGAQRTGALIVIERETGLQDTAESGVMLDSALSVDMLGTIFTPRAPLHDGAVIVRGNRILAAGAVLPLSETGAYRERFGTRHRAALGISEVTDALAVVVSEETGSIGLVERGRIIRNMDEERLRNTLITLLGGRGGRGRLPARARALRRGLPTRSRPHLRRSSEARDSSASREAAPARSAGSTPARSAGSTPAPTPGGRAK